MPATDGFFRNLPKTHMVFAVSSLMLLGATLWMLHDDHNDEWRVWQQKFDRIEDARLAGVGLDQQDELSSTSEELKQQIAERNAHLESIKADLGALQATLAEQQGVAATELRATKPLRTFRDVARANYDLAVRDNDSSVDAKLQEFQKRLQAVDAAERKLRAAQDAVKDTQAKLSKLTGKQTEAETTIASLETAVDLTKATRDDIAPESTVNLVKRWLMEQPIVDGFNSHHKVRQDWLPDQRITLGMSQTARFDRCRTCHLGIDRVLAGNVPEFPFSPTARVDDKPTSFVAAGGFPHPFATHPRPDVYLTAASPHPLTEFGCTVCHDGQGSATSFHNAQHGPNHPADYKKWNGDYGFFPNHYWEYPMPPRRLRESTCLKCHHQVLELGINPEFGATAPKLYKGWQLVRKFGCFGCNEISGFDGTRPIGPDLRLEAATAELKAVIDADPNQVGGKMRKVGPSLAHVGLKTNQDWLGRWIRKPADFRPTTRMPQFFDLTNQGDAHAQKFTPIEIAAVTHFLLETSKQASSDFQLDTVPKGVTADAKRGAIAFRERGCLACHSHAAVPDPGKQLSATFGPDLSRIQDKVGHDTKNPANVTNPGFRWLYTWIRNPQKHFPRTRMPDLFLDPEGQGDKQTDPAADIAAFLLSRDNTPLAGEPVPTPNDAAIDELVELFAGKVIGTQAAKDMISGGGYPETDKSRIKGDEVELHGETLTRDMKLMYLGRRTINRYGCYGCHDIPGFEEARPIGTKLEDWGRKDRTKLAIEHIEEFLHHHGEADGGSTRQRVDREMARARAHSLGEQKFPNRDVEEDETRAAFFYGSLVHHGREGFLWQKLRAPRSYDHKKTETKGYDERLRMPRFTFARDPMENEKAIEAIATFILGLVAEPPPVKYVYQPDTQVADRIEGERLLQKFNCVGCHMVDAPEIQVTTTLDGLPDGSLAAAEYPEARDLLLKIRPARAIQLNPDAEGKISYSFHGLSVARPGPDDDDLDPDEREYSYNLWEPITFNWMGTDDKGKRAMQSRTVLPSTRMLVAEPNLVSETPARGGRFAEWLVNDILDRSSDPNRDLAWQASPPPLIAEGIKVQTPWLYRFLKNPGRLRHTTVLRMPRFNMDDDEARALANYFAAADRAEYPYQPVPQRQPAYLDNLNASFEHPAHDYLTESWHLFNAPLCIKCHSLGGRQFKAVDPKKDIRGPNLGLASDRLQPDWLQVWLSNPKWVTPYTSMPQPFAKNQRLFPQHFGGNGLKQTTAVRDALMNYNRLMERDGTYIPPPTAKPAAAAATNGQGAAQP